MDAERNYYIGGGRGRTADSRPNQRYRALTEVAGGARGFLRETRAVGYLSVNMNVIASCDGKSRYYAYRQLHYAEVIKRHFPE